MISFYVGDTGTGKTSLALKHAKASVAETGRPLIVVDTVKARNFDGLSLSDPCDSDRVPLGLRDGGTVPAALWLAYGRGEHVRFVPDNHNDLGRLLDGLRAGRDFCILFDEAGFWMAHNRFPDSIAFVLRASRHCGADVYATTQYIKDIPQAALNCVDRLYIFRTSAPAALERLAETWNIPPEKVSALKGHEYIKWSREQNSP